MKNCSTSKQMVINMLVEQTNLPWQTLKTIYPMLCVLEKLPSTPLEDQLEKIKKRILQAGKEGREIKFWLDGRLFAIREMAQ